ncbi:hypothetical protein OUZ56_003796 [Daphnia magna]|uniref:Unconventional myosin-XVIIIa n=1 Tax=Daphnia magna TaxID=35525 RepID=A0ABQ9YMY0_9CRUS|nr:hypothetical protein OUZ56_003796 [Daphnia magna]
MRISTSNPIISQQHRPYRTDNRRNEDDPRVDPLDSAPAVADRIKAFEDLIRRASRCDATKEDGDDGDKRKKKESIVSGSQWSAGWPIVSDVAAPTSRRQTAAPTTSSSGYTSTTPPSPEPELPSRRYIYLTAHRVQVDHFAAHDDDKDDVEEEDKQIELEIFARNPSSDDRLFSATSTDDEVDVDEDDVDDIRWSDLESEMDLDQVVDVLIQSKTSNEVFFRPGVLSQLEDQRDEKITSRVVKFQAQCRGFLARKRLIKLKVQDVAIRCIQRNVRKLQAIQVWPWWRLMLRLSPLLNVHRTEEELKARTEEAESLRSRVTALEKERADLKYVADRLETKIVSIQQQQQQSGNNLT